jgi:hypothetical protein
MSMGYESSMLYTMGTALDAALRDQTEVSVLVEGAWLTGSVVLYDGTGVVLDNGDNHSIVKVASINAVKVLAEVPWQRSITEREEAPFAPSFDQPMPMPGPRSSAEA